MRLVAKIKCFIFSFLVLLSFNSFADLQAELELNLEPAREILEETGTVFYIDNGLLNISVDMQEILKSIPNLQKANIINPDITQTNINLNRVEIAEFIALFNAGLIIMKAYESSIVDKLNTHVYLVIPDDYGNKKKHLAFSFKFDRKIYEKINWSSFSPENLPKVALSFKEYLTYSADE